MLKVLKYFLASLSDHRHKFCNISSKIKISTFKVKQEKRVIWKSQTDGTMKVFGHFCQNGFFCHNIYLKSAENLSFQSASAQPKTWFYLCFLTFGNKKGKLVFILVKLLFCIETFSKCKLMIKLWEYESHLVFIKPKLLHGCDQASS